MLYFIAATATVLFVYLYARYSAKAIYIRKLLLPFSCLAFVLCLVIFPETTVSAAAGGFKLWLEAVVPSLMPFIVVSNLLVQSGFAKSAGILLEPLMRPLFNIPGSGSFAFLVGITSGYPVGAKITSDLYSEKLLTEDQARRLLAFSNNSGPLFIIGTVSTGMFKSPSLGLFLLLCHVTAGITVGVLQGLLSRKRKTERETYLKKGIYARFKKQLKTSGGHNWGNLLGNAVADAMQTLLKIGGFITLFSVLIALLRKTGIVTFISGLISMKFSLPGLKPELAEALICGFFEITTGCSLVSGLADTPMILKLAAVSFILGWAGLSVHAQVLGITSQRSLGLKEYLTGKFLHGILAALYACALYRVLGSSIPVLSHIGSKQKIATDVPWHYYFINSVLLLAVMCGLFAALFTALNLLKKTCIRDGKRVYSGKRF